MRIQNSMICSLVLTALFVGGCGSDSSGGSPDGSEYSDVRLDGDYIKKHDDEKSQKEESGEQTSNNSGNNQNGGGGETSSGGTTIPTASGKYRLLAWNDLGMHCMDGNDYSVFSILPPYNTLNAQLVERRDGDAKKISSGVRITYEAVPSLNGKWNTVSSTKTNFWQYTQKLFGANLAKDIGLKGYPVQSKTSHAMEYQSAHEWWIAEGIPTVPQNDDGSTNHYPMVKVVAKDMQGNLLASTTTVLPVSDEMDCRKCHASNTNPDAKPTAGWVNLPDSQKDYKYNILRLHDDENDISSYLAALKAKGYNYQPSLYETAQSGTPVLCASCHQSNALPGTGVTGVPPLTEAIHSKHANVTDPLNGQKLDNQANRNACYTCHPGATTQCLRGAMGNAKNSDGTMKMQCQSCHGGMSAVGKKGREGWLDEPNCQSCHQDGHRYTEAVTDFATGTLRAALDNRFATNPDTPVKGKSLYRFSTGHKGMQCSACHGSTHAVYPTAREEDNLQSKSAQGHAGTINDCTACHLTVPKTADGGPHGMHTVGQDWVKMHEDVAEKNSASCRACHGADYRGSVLSKTFAARTFSVEHGTKTFAKGHMVSCYDCHNGPGGD